jgi:dTDP-L-rhamnose 4-epimerase
MKLIDKVLVTGGAGFIGSWTTDLLLDKGYDVTVLDTLEPQVHGKNPPGYLNQQAQFVKGDVRDRKLLADLVREADAVIHLAALVGVGQSMYQVNRYVDHNTKGTAILLDVLINENNSVKKLIVASSMSIYGEGKYYCEKCSEIRYPSYRNAEHLKNKIWEPLCQECSEILKPLPTDEDKPPMPTSIYAMSKRHQEEMCLLVGKTYGIPTLALRYFNVYGSRQALSNPYTGCVAIFLSRILNNKPPYIFEDGEQLRDFVHVKDVAKANVLAMEKSSADYTTLNVGSGRSFSIATLASLLINACGAKLEPYISQRYRRGDIRHCYADIKRASKLLGYRPSVGIREALKDIFTWAKDHHWGAIDLFEKALRELEERKLVD